MALGKKFTLSKRQTSVSGPAASGPGHALAQHVEHQCIVRTGLPLESRRQPRAGQRRTKLNITKPKGNV